MGDKSKYLFIGIAALVLGVIIYFLFFKESEEKIAVSSAKYSGTSFSGMKIQKGSNTYKSDTKNINNTYNQGGDYYGFSNKETNNSKKYLRDKNGKINYSSGFTNISENQYNIYIKKSGETLAFGSVNPELEKAIPPLKVPGYSSGAYNASRKFQEKSKNLLCVAIIEEVFNGAEEIKKMDEMVAKLFILDRLRYIPGFGGFSQKLQERYVNDIYQSIMTSKPLDIDAMCKDMDGQKGSLLYQQCLKVVEEIIVQDVRDPATIEKMLLEGIPDFRLLSASERKMIVDMIVQGMNEGNLSKEKICSLLVGMIIDKFKDMLLFQKCIMVMNELSAMPVLTPQIVEKKLYEIPGFSSLSKSQIKQVVDNIMNDPREDGSLDAERHCLDIVSMILALIEGTHIYQACIKIMDEIIAQNVTDPKKIAEMVAEIPGFNVLNSTLQNQVIQSVIDAVNDGNLEEDKQEICRNITALILDELNKNNIFKQCRAIIENLVETGGYLDETKVREELAKIPNFSVLPKEKVDQIVKDVMAIDKTKDVNVQIINICTDITSSIIDYIKGTEIYKICMKKMDEIIAEGINTEEGIRQKLNEIPGFALLPKKDQDKFVADTLEAVMTGTLEQKKEDLCIAISSAILETLDKNQLYQQCIKLVTAIFDEGKNKDRDYVLAELRKLPKFTSFSIDVQNKYVDEIIAIEEPDIPAKIQVFCANYVKDVESLGNIVQCVKKLASIVIYENRAMTRNDVRNHMMSVPSFVKATYEQQEELITKVMNLTEEKTNKSHEKVYREVEKFASEVFLLPEAQLQNQSTVLQILSKITNFNQISSQTQSKLATDLVAVVRSCGSTDPKDCNEQSVVMFKQIAEQVIKVSTLTFEIQLSELTKICNDLESNKKPTAKPDPSTIKPNIKDPTKKPTTDPSIINPNIKEPTIKPTISPDKGGGLPAVDISTVIDLNILNDGNFQEIMRRDYGECAALNKTVFEGYKEYLSASIKNPNIIEDHKITELNQNQPDGQYYIPLRFESVVQKDLLFDFEKILSNEGKDDSKNSIARTLYFHFTESQLTAISKLSMQTKASLISRVYTDMVFLKKTSLINHETARAYISEAGKCVNPFKDQAYWEEVSENMQLFIEGKKDPIFGFEHNANPSLSREQVISSKAYNEGIVAMEDLINQNIANHPSLNQIVLLRLNQIDRFWDVQDVMRYKAISSTIDLIKNCTNYKTCSNAASDIVFDFAYQIKDLPDNTSANPRNLANIAKCYDYTIDYPRKDQLFGNLPIETRSMIADNVWILMQNFELSAKDKRREIINKIWIETKKEFEKPNVNNEKLQPVPVSVCERAMEEVWGDYNDEHLRNIIKGPFEELINEVSGLLSLFDLQESVKDYTNPPSKKCKCYMQKISQHLHAAQNIKNYNDCRGDQNKNSAFVKMMASKYVTSKDAAVEALAQEGADGRGKYLCSLIFRNVIDIIDDQAEAVKFTNLNVDQNAHILNQICVQQLRDIYSTIEIFRNEYFEPDEEGFYSQTSTNCDSMPD